MAGQSGVKGMCGSQSEVWLIDKKVKGRPHNSSPLVTHHGQVAEHAPDHVTEHMTDHVTSRAA